MIVKTSMMKEVWASMKIQELCIDYSSSHGFSEQLMLDVVSKCSDIFTIIETSLVISLFFMVGHSFQNYDRVYTGFSV